VWGRMARILSSTHTKDHPKNIYIDDNTILLKKERIEKRKTKRDVEKRENKKIERKNHDIQKKREKREK
jgi:hypothetical protein